MSNSGTGPVGTHSQFEAPFIVRRVNGEGGMCKRQVGNAILNCQIFYLPIVIHLQPTSLDPLQHDLGIIYGIMGHNAKLIVGTPTLL